MCVVSNREVVSLYKRLISLFCVICICIGIGAGSYSSSNATNSADLKSTTNEKSSNTLIKNNNYEYLEYLKAIKEPQYPVMKEDIVVEAGNYSGILSVGAGEVIQKYKGRKNVLKLESDLKSLEYAIDIQSEGLYEIGLTHYPLSTNFTSYQIALKINDETPFSQAENIMVYNQYLSKSNKPIVDENGNQFADEYIVNSNWTSQVLCIKSENIDEPLRFYLKKGKNNLRFSFNQSSSLILGDIFIRSIKTPPKYSEYRKLNNNISKGKTLKQVEAEASVLQSDSIIRPFAERTDPLMSPYNASHLMLNCVDSSWSSHGQWLEWNFEVKESGWYRLSFRYMQDAIAGIGSRRKIMLDGAVPFEEFSCINFPYSSSWNLFTAADKDGSPYELYIESGYKHTIKMEVVLGDLIPVINEVDNIAYGLNVIYRKIIMITSLNADRYRDYNLDTEIPNLLADFESYVNRVKKCSQSVLEISGGNASNSAILNTLERQLRSFIDDPKTIPYRMGSLQSNVGSVSAWALDLRKQPLNLDYFLFWQNDAKLAKSKANILDIIVNSVTSFYYSFVKDYSNFSTKEQGESITMWFGGGQEQGEIIWKMTNDLFSAKNNIKVNIKLVNASIVEAFLSGKTPDVAINLPRDTPINLALRGALWDLSSFEDFNSVNQQFTKGAMVPYTFQNSVYALPDTQIYNMLFYRKDILNELDLSVPRTWTEFTEIANQLHLYNLETGATGEGDASLYYSLLLQKEASVFSSDLSKTLLDSPDSLYAFTTWTDMYNKTGLPLNYSFFNRFRSGEMPLAIVPYTMYGQLEAAAPEIRGLWDVALIPGTLNANGDINRSVSATGTAAAILQSTKHPRASWEFIKWWSGDEAQERFARDVESKMGVIARIPLANVYAFEKQGWPSSVASLLREQRAFIQEIPQIPGQYYLDRDLNNAFKDVVYNKNNPFESILKYGKRINEEISRKRGEFGLE